MSKVMYISYNESEGVMSSLGFSLLTLKRDESLTPILRRLKKQNITLIYVSEEVYSNHAGEIGEYDTEFSLAIGILANAPESDELAEKRLNRLVEDAVGVKLTEKEERV